MEKGHGNEVASYVLYTFATSFGGPYLCTSITTEFSVRSLVDPGGFLPTFTVHRCKVLMSPTFTPRLVRYSCVPCAFRIAPHYTTLCVPYGSRWVPHSYVPCSLYVLMIIANAEVVLTCNQIITLAQKRHEDLRTKDKRIPKKASCQKYGFYFQFAQKIKFIKYISTFS